MKQTIIGVHREQVGVWIENFHALLRHCIDKWNLWILEPPAVLSFCLPVMMGDGQEAVLKLGCPGKEMRTEIAALQSYDGRGAARLLDYDDSRGVLLLERLKLKIDKNFKWGAAMCKPKILILGTFHMAPTTDLFSIEIDDFLSEKRQQEIRDVVERLKEYKPTKIAVEVETKQNDKINEKYKHYLQAKYELELNEIYQIGFRLAAQSAHDAIYCIDWMEQGAGKRGAGDVYEWAKENQPELFNSIFGWLHEIFNNTVSPYKSVLDMYRECNEPTATKRHHIMNINLARIGTDDDYVGMDWLIWWYQRNLIMFSNIARIANSHEDRILLIVGAAHVRILAQFLDDSGIFEVQPIENYLKADKCS